MHPRKKNRVKQKRNIQRPERNYWKLKTAEIKNSIVSLSGSRVKNQKDF